MKEQVIATRGSRSSRSAAAQPRGFVQRPARRGSSTGGRTRDFSPRALYGYVPSALKLVLAIVTVVTLIIGYRVASSASLFQVRSIDVSGASRTSAAEIESLTRRAVARTGVWRADLSAISTELERLPGVRRAVVSRVLPDRLRVRVSERVPVAVVHTSAGHFFWVDEEGVALGEMKAADTVPAFFIRGWNEDGTEEARKENVERVQRYVEVSHEWNALALSERVSEVNLIDLRDVRAQLSGNDSQIEVRLGGQELGVRLKLALDALDQYRQRGSSITYLDLQTGRIVIGTNSGSKVSTASEPPVSDSTNQESKPVTPIASVSPVAANANRRVPSKDQQKPIKTNRGHDSANTSGIRLR